MKRWWRSGRVTRPLLTPASGLFVLASCIMTPFMSFVLAPTAPPVSKAVWASAKWQGQKCEKRNKRQDDLRAKRASSQALVFITAAAALGLSSLRNVARKAESDGQLGKCMYVEPTTVSTGTCAARTPPCADACIAGSFTPSLPFLPSANARENSKRLITRNLLMPLNITDRKPRKPLVKPWHHSTKWKFHGYDTVNNKPYFGKYAIQACEEAWISSKTIEEVRRVLVRTMARKGRNWIRIFPDQGITQRVAESRMGAGKGSIDHWVKAVRPGQILFEVDGVSKEIALLAFHKAKFRFSCRTKVLIKDDGPSRYELGLEGDGGSRAERKAKAMAEMAAKKEAAAKFGGKKK